MKRIVLICLSALTIAIPGFLIATPAHATNGPQICSTAAGSICMNSNKGAHNPGDYVISWHAGDTNNTFEAHQLTGICGDGYVDGYNNGACPFPNGSGLNDRYNGDAIVEFIDYTTITEIPPLCVAATPNGFTAEYGCSPNGGYGGGIGSIQILSGVTNFPEQGVNPYWVVNLHYSNSQCGLGKPTWMVSSSLGAPMVLTSCTANNQFYEVP